MFLLTKGLIHVLYVSKTWLQYMINNRKDISWQLLGEILDKSPIKIKLIRPRGGMISKVILPSKCFCLRCKEYQGKQSLQT